MADTLEPFLAKLPFFEGLERRHVQLLAGCASNARYMANEYLCREGEDADQFFIIRQGKVSIEMAVPGRGVAYLESHEEGAVVGWAGLLRLSSNGHTRVGLELMAISRITRYANRFCYRDFSRHCSHRSLSKLITFRVRGRAMNSGDTD